MPYVTAADRARIRASLGKAPRVKMAMAIVKRKDLARQRKFFSRKEVKYLDYSTTYPTAIAVGGNAVCLNQIAEGDDYNQRDGRMIFGKYVQVDCMIHAPSTSGNDWGFAAIVIDLQSNLAAPNFSDVFNAPAGNLGASFKNLASSQERFKIIKFQTWHVEYGSPDNNVRIRWFVKIPVACSRSRYNGTIAAIPGSNACYFVIASSQNTGSTVANGAGLALTTRFAFNDG